MSGQATCDDPVTTPTTTATSTLTTTATSTATTTATTTITTTPLLSGGDIILNGTGGQVVDIAGAIQTLQNVDIVTGSVIIEGTIITSVQIRDLLSNVVEIRGSLTIDGCVRTRVFCAFFFSVSFPPCPSPLAPYPVAPCSSALRLCLTQHFLASLISQEH
jgi:hypothetical protein